MFPSAVWRPLAASFSIAVIIVYSWLGGSAGFQAAEWSGQKVFPQQNTSQPIPQNIWQINFDHPEWKDERLQKSVRSWTAKNSSYQHVILDEEAGRQFAQRHYSHDSYILNTYLELGSTILRADYLRYLVLAAEGGIYSDLDTDAVQPIDSWFSDHSYKQTRAIVGLEFDILQRTDLPLGFSCRCSFVNGLSLPALITLLWIGWSKRSQGSCMSWR